MALQTDNLYVESFKGSTFHFIILACEALSTSNTTRAICFRYSYIVPLPKPKKCYSKNLTYDDFRGIVISPVMSKGYKHCMLDRFGSFSNTFDNQFDFKKGLECSFAIRFVRNVVDGLTKGGSTVNLCALDLSKAFDKVNHHALYLQELIRR